MDDGATKSDAPAQAAKKKLCDFPDVFTGVRMSLPQNRLLRRYFIAYDGILAKSDGSDATHVLASSAAAGKSSRSVKIVTVNWLWDSIRQQKRQDEAKYSV